MSGAPDGSGSSGQEQRQPAQHAHDQPRRWRVRRATARDADAVGRICGQAFGVGALPGMQDNPSVRKLEGRYAVAIEKDVAEKLRAALAVKDKVMD
jgi:hypothetical protein